METLELDKKSINAIKELKKDIKEAVEKQLFLKNQRKTKRIIGERKIEPWTAAMYHRENREKLRTMYAAYASLNNKEINKIDSLKFDEEYQKGYFLKDVINLVNLYKDTYKDEM